MLKLNEFQEYIQSYPDFPNKGINFKDIFGLLQEPNIFRTLINKMASSENIQNCDTLLSIDARGFIFGSGIALVSKKPMIVARKPNKLPGNLIQKEYNLEYGKNALAIQKDALKKYHKICIIDDILATGGTAECVQEMLESEGKEVLGFMMVIELISLNGAKKLTKPVESLIKM